MANEKIKITIDNEKCKGCMLCVKACPQKAIKTSGKVNKSGQQYVIVDHPEKCTGCALCFLMCPDCAIEIEKIDDGENR